MRINQGYFFADTYTKTVSFSKAVLWKDRQISLGKPIMDRIRSEGITSITFKDPKKKEVWMFKTLEVIPQMELKVVGQEEQYYFPIELAYKRDFMG